MTLTDPTGLTSEECSQSNDDDDCCNDPNYVSAECGGDGWPSGWPIWGGGGGGGGGSSPTPTPTANNGGPGIPPGMGNAGFPNGFLGAETDAIDLNVIFRITTWGWPWIAGGVAACAIDPVCAVPAATVAVAGAGYLVYKGIQAGVQIYQTSAKAKDDRKFSDNPICNAQYLKDLKTCSKVAWTQRSSCYAQAMERLIACEGDKPLPPLPF